MEINKTPENWNDCGMDWNDPDPANPSYYFAIREAIAERMRALSLSDPAWFPYTYSYLYDGNRAEIISIRTIEKFSSLIKYILRRGQYIFHRELFFRNVDKPLTFADSINAVWTYPMPWRGAPLSAAGDFLIWAKKMLDSMTLFAYPYVKIGHYSAGEYGGISDVFFDKPELQHVEDIQKRLLTAFDLFVRKYDDAIRIRDVVTQTFDANLHTYAESGNARVDINIRFPAYVICRNFTRPHLYCVVKTHPVSPLSHPFSDFGYGFEPGDNRILDLGQLSGEKDEKNDLYSFRLERLQPYLTSEDGKYYDCNIRFYFVFDYNVEGGFKFRPDL